VDAVGQGRRITYDARGLAEPDAAVPRVAAIEGDKASFDAAKLSIRQINLELRWLLYDEGITDVTVSNPGAKHSLGVGILTRCRVRFEGSLGYFGCGLIDGPEITITGRVGWSVCEGMMSGVVMIEKNAGSLTAAGLRGGDVVVIGDVGARTGVDQKGGTIIVLGNGGMNSGFMMQRGRQIFCGDVGPGLGDSIYDGAIFVAGAVKSLGVDCVEAELNDADREMIARKFSAHDLGSPPALRKFTSGKQLWNYDNLEPNERKMVL
jgi:methylamine---glutamate N-methyltransferase subunit B